MFIDLLLLSLYIAIFELIDKFLSKSLKKQLAIEPTSNGRILIRHKVRRNRLILLTFLILLLIGTEISLIYDAIYSYQNYRVATKGFITFPIVCIVYLCIQNKWKRIKGNISTSDLESFDYKNIKYALFLRGFYNDDYTKIDKLDNPETDIYSHFSEYQFFRFLSKKHKTPIITVGMTRELDSPMGAKRIYLDDEEWQTSVQTLMQYAERIFILVNDRNSCKWEITQSKNFLEKTTFIVDNKDKYISVKEEIKGLFNMPSIELANNQCAIIQLVPTPQIHYLDNSGTGYANTVGVKYTSVETKKKRFKRTFVVPAIVIWGIILAIILLSVISAICSTLSAHSENYRYRSLSTTEALQIIQPFSEIRSAISRVQLPLKLSNGLTIISIDVLEEQKIIRHVITADKEGADLDLSQKSAKDIVLTATKQSCPHYMDFQFLLNCANYGICLEYSHRHSSNHDIDLTITVEDLRRYLHNKGQL